METITSKDFENYYGVSLLPYSTETTQIAEIIYKKGLFTRTLEYQNETLLDVSISTLFNEQVSKNNYKELK